jgi:membrane protease YdiL (CAAX protease family)
MTRSYQGDITVGFLLLFLLTMLSSVGLKFPPFVGLFWVVAFAIAFVWIHTHSLGQGRPVRHAAILRLRPLRQMSGWIALAAPFMVVFGLGIGGLLQLWAGPIHSPLAPSGPTVLGEVAASPGGWLLVTSYAVLTGPLIEEFSFRGWIQRSLERKLGPALAIAVSALLFSLLHLWYGRPHFLLIPLMLGVVWGSAVYVTGSIWAGVILHGTWNAAMMLAVKLRAEPAAVLPFPKSRIEIALYGIVVVGAVLVLAWEAGRAGSKRSRRGLERIEGALV